MIKFSDLETKYGLKTVKSFIVNNKDEALKYAELIGYPVALKIESQDILHKSDIGAVKLDLKDRKQLSFEYDEILKSVEKKCPDARIEGITVQEMLPEGFELIIGYVNEKNFGPCLMTGMGGIFTEVIKDISFRALPITKTDAVSMIKELKFSDMLLKGYRNMDKVSIDTLADVLLKTSQVAMENKRSVESFDINPAIFVGDDYRIVDFKYIKKEAEKEEEHDDIPDVSELDKFYNASSVAVIGVSPKKGKLGYTILDNLKTNGYKGKVYPINPKYDSILGLKSYPDLVSIKGDVDLVIVLISLGAVSQILEQCNEKNIKNVIIISAGGKEIGMADLEYKIKEEADNYGIRIIGCNCLGVFDARSKLDSMFFPYDKLKRPLPGGICLLSQSGTVGLTALDILPNLSKFTSYGNRIDVDEADLIKYFSSCKDTRVISAYIEGLSNGRKLYNTVKSVTPDIPVVVYKAGRSELASRASMSHTGFLAGTHSTISGILRQANAFQVDSFESLLSASRSLDFFNRVKSNNTLLVTNGAGVTIQAIDRIEARQILKLADLSEDSLSKLKELVGDYVILSNPVDLTGSCTEKDFEDILAVACEDKGIDIIMLYIVLHLDRLTENMMDIVEKYMSIKPVLFCSAGAEHTTGMKEILEKRGVPTFTTVEEWVIAAEALTY